MLKKGHLKYFSLTLVILSLISASFNTNTSQADTSGRGTWAVYTPKEQMISQWKTLCDAYPNVASYESIGKTIQGRDIWLFKIGNPSGAAVMYDGQSHGPEDGGTETLLKFCRWLLESDESVANHILESNYHLIIPILNMDTNARQNMRRTYVLDNGTIINVLYGVDLNRNSLYNWGYSGSSDPENDYSYRGLYAGSEPETMAYHSAAEKYQPYVYVNTHIGAESMITYSNTAFEQEITSLISQYQQQYNVTYSYPIHYSRGGSGSIAADPDNNFGASGWLWEICTWESLKPTLSEWLDLYYPRVFPIFLAFAKAAENKHLTSIPAPIPTPTPLPTPKPAESSNQLLTHDIAITNITISPYSSDQSQLMEIKVNVSNRGNYKELFNIVIYANEIPIESRKVTLKAKTSTTLDFVLDTLTLPPGDYIITAFAEPVPNENSEADNSLQLTSSIQVVLPTFPEEPVDIDSEEKVRDPTPILLIIAAITTVFITPLLIERRKRRPLSIVNIE